ncbi:hypothetical protein CAPTEDRAFT_210261 [Capitella teleta]|uniref:Uncharacterized protein n=1 Tax=Capitella teleta TaxID=283909 RepID=N1PB30_CAPTE|nr:hypothetical protein CAPTEDRAFT_210261 [Capitella teleta]|eukprot:ELU18797.1 hypothetical protein CAPTEDRAFT_210261 [Capitella teleta]
MDHDGESSDDEHAINRCLTSGSGKGEPSEKDWLYSYEDDLEDDATAPDIKLARKRFRKGLRHEKVQEQLEKVQRPANCPFMEAPRVNSEIWPKLKANKPVKYRDLRLSAIQRAIGGGRHCHAPRA